ncbi:hypothetical protein EFK50_11395 [Nocardioides marmoriginsengisoli]|uniref:Cytochrome c oxidase assembly protein n=1 Tax=Nocardioides marmoriginsengisoli TaxID=661483 RepID=A0A3N0CFZ0_9ACTN|nr:hypothetical protein [Nocardioides marmoriginsengisoli]RNL62374.1 hypothetical protein EFK50_11395 [Nocardioides marmoriginsengisoli]
MACCLLLLRLLAPVSSRLGIGDPARAPRLPVVPIALLGLVEAAVAVVLVRRADGSAPAGHLHHLAADPAAGAITLGTVCAVTLTALVAVLGLRWSGRARHPVGLVGVGVAVVAALVAVSGAAAASHALMMVVVELALVVGPVAIVGARVNAAPAEDLWVVVRGFLALAAAAVAGFLLVTLHLPATHHWYLAGDGLTWWSAPVLLASGLAFWSSVVRFRLPPGWRALLLVAVLETGAVIGLVLLLAGDRLVPMVPGSGLGVVADQRLAGAVMMLVDLGLLARVVEPVLRPLVGRVPVVAPR